ncbi:MAG: carboxylating nicotinate-nucleotide diphosphorylase, partial [Planctomycetes bacterium]|nr:carboxylating nicotinate-nucleotide diphosphorylase [Planctomycetota bacterium]
MKPQINIVRLLEQSELQPTIGGSNSLRSNCQPTDKHGINALITRALKEDIGSGDITTNTLIAHRKVINACIVAKENGIIAGLPLIKAIYRKLNKMIRIDVKVKEGARAKNGQIVAIINGPARAILSGERTVLNFLQRLSGIATYTNEFVRRVRPYRTKILDTRKTAPGWRSLDKYAVKIGGGQNHRFGLYDAGLIKTNHLTCVEDMPLMELVKRTQQIKKLGKFLEIEARNLVEVTLALTFQPDIIMLDNMRLADIRESVKLVRLLK